LPADPPGSHVSGTLQNLKTLTKLSNGTKIDGIGWAWEGHLRGGGEEVRDELLSGAVVGVTVCDMAKESELRSPQASFHV
jgi:hypothetical protein